MSRIIVVACVLGWLAAPLCARAADQPQWGEARTRNQVSTETGLPDTFEPGKRGGVGGNIELPPDSGVRWVAKLGGQSYGTPVVAGGRVFVGTNNESPRDARFEEDRGVMMCFDEKSGAFLWQLSLPKLVKIKWSDWHYLGITATPVVEGDRLYLVSNRAEVMCLDVHGMANGNDGPFKDEGRLMAGEGKPPIEPGDKAADILWVYDMPAELDIEPHNASNSSVLLVGDLLYVCTGNGVDWTHEVVKKPNAPTAIVLDKRTGKLLARDDFRLGIDIIHGQWSAPAMGEVEGVAQVYQGCGNGFLYAYKALDEGKLPDAPVKLKTLWSFNGHPLAQTQDHVPLEHIHDTLSYEVTANPVFYRNRVYCHFTQEVFHTGKLGWLCCIDPTQSGNVTRTAKVWSYDKIGGSVSTPAIADGLVYAAGFDGKLHCLDAQTGEVYWVHDAGKPIWGSPLATDGKVYLGTGSGVFWVLKQGKKLEVVSRIRMRDGIFCSPTAANGTLFIATAKHLYAVGK